MLTNQVLDFILLSNIDPIVVSFVQEKWDFVNKDNLSGFAVMLRMSEYGGVTKLGPQIDNDTIIRTQRNQDGSTSDYVVEKITWAIWRSKMVFTLKL